MKSSITNDYILDAAINVGLYNRSLKNSIIKKVTFGDLPFTEDLYYISDTVKINEDTSKEQLTSFMLDRLSNLLGWGLTQGNNSKNKQVFNGLATLLKPVELHTIKDAMEKRIDDYGYQKPYISFIFDDEGANKGKAAIIVANEGDFKNSIHVNGTYLIKKLNDEYVNVSWVGNAYFDEELLSRVTLYIYPVINGTHLY